ncbi:MAG: hypothetical protein ACJ72N_25420 [Labedaea sp.]
MVDGLETGHENAGAIPNSGVDRGLGGVEQPGRSLGSSPDLAIARTAASPR